MMENILDEETVDKEEDFVDNPIKEQIEYTNIKKK